MCSPKTCQVETCQTQNDTKTRNGTQLQLSEFMRPFPSAHYGYGFVDRQLRGLKMQTQGSAQTGSGCAISHKYQFLYVHVLKSGGTSLKGFLQKGLCADTRSPCATGKDNLEIVNCASAIEKYPHYFVFSFVRNPFSRMYSAFAMANSFRDHATKPLPPFSFEQFALGSQSPIQRETLDNDTSTTTTQRRLLSAQETTTSLHQTFAYPMPRGAQRPPPKKGKRKVTKNEFRKKLTYLHPSHWQPQSNFLFTRRGCPVFDFLGHLETMKDDLQRVLTYVDSPELWQQFHNQSTKAKDNRIQTDNSTSFGARQKEKALGGNLQTAYRYQQEEPNSNGQQQTTSLKASSIQQAVAEEYKRDFLLLGYDPNLVPP